jgi:hypothetical protein
LSSLSPAVLSNTDFRGPVKDIYGAVVRNKFVFAGGDFTDTSQNSVIDGENVLIALFLFSI